MTSCAPSPVSMLKAINDLFLEMVVFEKVFLGSLRAQVSIQKGESVRVHNGMRLGWRQWLIGFARRGQRATGPNSIAVMWIVLFTACEADMPGSLDLNEIAWPLCVGKVFLA
mmetsp:Transcript_127503/g.248498  ORF Transcript_127503/g.248498 Transcript_127503/m.248498 type:complete len:112 (-) Transcript_127503:976-1311(-)